MKKFIAIVSMSWILGLGSLAYAGQDKFCAGFEEGYKTIKGDMVIVPICPIAPITPIGSTDFREGIKAGIKAASR
jgi:hypothetical protein